MSFCWIRTQKPEDIKLQTEVSVPFFPHPPLSSEEEKVGYASGRNSTFLWLNWLVFGHILSLGTNTVLGDLEKGLVTYRVEKHPSVFL